MAAHLHLDALGGVAGDMFAAAVFDLDPALVDGAAAGLVPLLRSAGLAGDVRIDLVDHDDGVFRGRRFLVGDPRERAAARKKGPGTFVFSQAAAAHAGHEHVPLSGILARIAGSDLSPGAKARATDIFTRIGVAEGAVHGLPIEDVALHEVGSQDSIADVVTAAVLLDRLDVKYGGLTGSVSSLPLGSGRVQTAHGELPVPAPATLKLLVGFLTHDDGRPGERVTPTGAAIVAHLCGGAPGKRPPGVIAGVGVGFGTRTFVGLSNILRATLTVTFNDSANVETATSVWTTRPLLQLDCELDDMSAEELAWAADHLRDVDGVRDVLLAPVVMKKGRPATALQVLCDEGAKDAVAAAIFAATTTLGLRCARVDRFELHRSEETTAGVRVKTAQRPGGPTAKADHDDIAGDALAARRAARARAEAAVGTPTTGEGDSDG
jgi:uncharacterized protein (TIGR00299 family) protein